MLTNAVEQVEAAFKKTVIPTGNVENRYINLTNLRSDAKALPVFVGARMVQIVFQVRDRVFETLDPIVNRQMTEMFVLETIPKIRLRGTRIVIADLIEQILAANPLEMVRHHHQAIWQQPTEIEDTGAAINPAFVPVRRR